MDWKKEIVSVYESRLSPAPPARPAFRLGASERELDRLEEAIRCRIPGALRSLLLQTNGMTEEIQIDTGTWVESSIVVYSVDEMIDANLYVREAFPQRNAERYFFFSTAGTDGIQFGSPAKMSRQDDAEVVAWYPDQTPETYMADGLEFFLHDWCTGQTTI